jgi:hypothetical protein
MKTNKPSKPNDPHIGTRHANPRKQRALQLGARSEHETGAKRERLIREAARRAE